MKKDKDLDYRVITPDRQLLSSSGYCMTSHHNNCPHQFDYGKCGCSCHKSSWLL